MFYNGRMPFFSVSYELNMYNVDLFHSSKG